MTRSPPISTVASGGTRMTPTLFSILIFVPNGSEYFWIRSRMERASSGEGQRFVPGHAAINATRPLRKFLKYRPTCHGEVRTRARHLDPEFRQQLMRLDTFAGCRQVESQGLKGLRRISGLQGTKQRLPLYGSNEECLRSRRLSRRACSHVL